MKKKITTITLLMAFAVIAVTGGTLAYFTDTADATNTFTMGNIDITLDEAVVIKNGDNKWIVENPENRTNANTYSGVYPGAVLPKDPIIHNTGTNAAYVRLKVTMVDNVMGYYNGGFDELINHTLQTDWKHTNTIVQHGNRIYTLTYQNVLPADGDTIAAFTHVLIPESITNTQATNIGGFEMKIKAEAIQADGFTNVTAAFEAFDKQV